MPEFDETLSRVAWALPTVALSHLPTVGWRVLQPWRVVGSVDSAEIATVWGTADGNQYQLRSVISRMEVFPRGYWEFRFVAAENAQAVPKERAIMAELWSKARESLLADSIKVVADCSGEIH